MRWHNGTVTTRVPRFTGKRLRFHAFLPGVRGSPLRQATLQPNQAVNVLNDRVKLITTVNTSIADWLQVSAHERNPLLQKAPSFTRALHALL
jgi:hypothetical protein